MSGRLAVFAYGSLVSRASVAETLGHDPPRPLPARLGGWRRRWSQARDNHRSEKEFVTLDGTTFDFCLGLNLEPGTDAGVEAWANGGLIEVTAAELERFDRREIRYDRVDVSAAVRPAGEVDFDAVFTYVAKPPNLALHPPPRAVILAPYVRACEAAFEALGPGELEAFRTSTGPPPVPVVEARLVRDEIPPGNPRAW